MVLRLFRRVPTDSIKSAVSLSTTLTSSIMPVVRALRWELMVLMVPDTLVEELREGIAELFHEVTDRLGKVNGEWVELMEEVNEDVCAHLCLHVCSCVVLEMWLCVCLHVCLHVCIYIPMQVR